MSSISPWQCGLHNSKERDNALFLNEKLSDLNILFPEHKITFPAHRLMMAKTSPYFENLFYGPMSMHDQEWKVEDNEIEPGVFKIVLAHCYEVNLLDENVEMTLQVYKLADFYMIDSLKSKCLEILTDAIPKDDSDIQYIMEYSTRYGLIDIEEKVYEIWSNKLNNECDLNDAELNEKIHKDISNLLLNLPSDKHKEFLSRFEHFNVLYFEESWHHPTETLPCDILRSIFESSTSKKDCEKRRSYIKGCISPKILTQFITREARAAAYLSIIDEDHSQAIYDSINQMVSDHIDKSLHINLHIPSNRVSSESLAIWSSCKYLFALYLSNVDDQSVPWVIDSVLPLPIIFLYLPRSSLSLNGLRSIIEGLKNREDAFIIQICSCNISKENKEEFDDMSFGMGRLSIVLDDEKCSDW